MMQMTDATTRESLASASADFVRSAFDERILLKHILDRKNELLGVKTNE